MHRNCSTASTTPNPANSTTDPSFAPNEKRLHRRRFFTSPTGKTAIVPPVARHGNLRIEDIMEAFVTSIVLIVAFLVLLLRFYMKEHRTTTFDWPRFVARVAVFSAIAAVLYVIPLFSINLPIFPSFLALHFDEIPIFVYLDEEFYLLVFHAVGRDVFTAPRAA